MAEKEAPHNGQLGVFALVSIGFFWVSGGIYGNEPIAATAPPAIVLIAMVTACLCFALPLALMSAEMATALPQDGGMVVAIAHAFGRRLGTHVAYWFYVCLALDATIYPLLLPEYWITGSTAEDNLARHGIAVALMLVIMVVNLTGLDWLLRLEMALAAAALAPCLAFFGFGEWRDGEKAHLSNLSPELAPAAADPALNLLC